jgi:hypothetical protein
MENLIDQLHDIEGLSPVSGWPLAIGYKLLIALGALLIMGLIFLLYRWVRFNRSWKKDTLLRLAALEKNLIEETARITLIDLSSYLRRIALKRFPRKECAGLVGEDWLKWLSKHDSAEFKWEEKGKLLVDAPYSPVDASASVPLVKELIQATKRWVQ